ncbi:MAG: heat-inducible transcriptional repressor HrcA [Acidobacteriota bacterium]|nr:heat-inducible transcriptional repressor HrcA [Acidobacteriota bacterium]
MVVRHSNQINPATHYPDLRARMVLSAVIEEFLMTGEPVGSKLISEKFAGAAGWSSATIRNVMSDLEEAGFLTHPHTSAGRVPTDKGYRFYVDNLLGVLQISQSDLDLINRSLGVSANEEVQPEKLLEKTSQLLSALSNNVGIVITPSLANDVLQHIKFVALADKKILVVLVSAPNIVHHKIIRLEPTLSQDELDRTANFLNAEFVGKNLTAIRGEILARMHEEKALFDKLLQTAMILCSESLVGNDTSAGAVYVDGASNIVAKPDFSGNFERLRELLRTIEEKTRLVSILNECLTRETVNATSGVQVFIGGETLAPALQQCALIAAPYRLGAGENAMGTLSVLGPTRLEYSRLIAIVGYIARLLEQTHEKENSPLVN